MRGILNRRHHRHACGDRPPDRIASLASFAALPGLVGSAGHERYIAWTERLAREGVGKVLAETIGHRFAAGADRASSTGSWPTARGRTERSVARLLRMLAGVDFADRLPAIRCPALFVVPGADPSSRPRTTRACAACPTTASSSTTACGATSPMPYRRAARRNCAASSEGLAAAAER